MYTQICIHNKRKDICTSCNLKVAMRHIITSRMYEILGYADFSYLGCDIETLIKHIEDQFRDEFSWDNYCTIWQVDHKLPLRAKDISIDEKIKRFHYLNTQPLTISENRTKSNKEQ